ncbi:hypothetical protein CVV38_01685 [Candidatus Peregrinibacteria bacterium HGW-Peregrinibacteria-1]|jgi:murein DD-endopeptidase MepM/ murein hydrolase activator NlpD|nr:MAG: hypothetical protein CVV38_01685 [Candidatus Peregrinibacteria bacterium HGW-Peregrinibacteria-1]
MSSQGSALKADLDARKRRQERALGQSPRKLSLSPRLHPFRNTASPIKSLVKPNRNTTFSSASYRLLKTAGFFSLAFVIIAGITKPTITTNARYSYDYISSYGIPGDVLVLSDEGYILKVNPQTTTQISRAGMTDFAVHVVESGDVLSLIAERYGVNVNSIMWANKLTNPNALKINQKLLIPPVSGVAYEVVKGDTIEKIAEKYGITAEDIIAQNGFSADTVIASGQKLLLPGAKPTTEDLSSGNYGNYASGKVIGTTSSPSGGKIFIMPTTGRISQGFNSGHYAYDIANRNSPAIWAAGSGKVIKAAKSGWNGGYGNYLIIDHGGGYQTLYAHFARIDVNLGDHVSQGEVLGIMGTTGRSTGIHLHFEVRVNGVKKNPGLFY